MTKPGACCGHPSARHHAPVPWQDPWDHEKWDAWTRGELEWPAQDFPCDVEGCDCLDWEPLRRTIAVDFDGVIHSYERGWQDGTIYGTPLPGTMDALQKLYSNDWRIVIFTCRVQDLQGEIMPERVTAVLDWIDSHRDRHSFVIDEVTNKKPNSAVVFLDDRAVRFQNWEQALEDIEAVVPTSCSSCLGEGLMGFECPECNHMPKNQNRRLKSDKTQPDHRD
jgi:hypothetical protein